MRNNNINDDSFIMIKPFMRKELNLKGNELMVYAIIHGFSMDGESFFYGSWQYLADWIGANKRTIANVLQSLINKGLLIKEDIYIDKVQRCKYCTTRSRQGQENNIVHETANDSDEKNSPEMMKNFHGGDEKNSSVVMKNFHPYYYSKKESKEREGASASPQPRPQSSNGNSTSKGFKKPTLEEVKAYIKEKQLNADGETFYDYYESVGWYVGKNKMKNWKASLNNWSRRESKFNMQNCSKQSMVTYAPVEFNNF